MILDWQIRNGGNGGGDNETEGTETQSYLILRQILSWLSANVQPEEDRTNTTSTRRLLGLNIYVSCASLHAKRGGVYKSDGSAAVLLSPGWCTESRSTVEEREAPFALPVFY